MSGWDVVWMNRKAGEKVFESVLRGGMGGGVFESVLAEGRWNGGGGVGFKWGGGSG